MFVEQETNCQAGNRKQRKLPLFYINLQSVTHNILKQTINFNYNLYILYVYALYDYFIAISFSNTGISFLIIAVRPKHVAPN
jgi:hypothetical protein